MLGSFVLASRFGITNWGCTSIYNRLTCGLQTLKCGHWLGWQSSMCKYIVQYGTTTTRGMQRSNTPLIPLPFVVIHHSNLTHFNSCNLQILPILSLKQFVWCSWVLIAPPPPSPWPLLGTLVFYYQFLDWVNTKCNDLVTFFSLNRTCSIQ